MSYGSSIFSFLRNLHIGLCVYVLSHSVLSDFVSPWTVAHQALLSMGILQARILEGVATPFSRGSSLPASLMSSALAGSLSLVLPPSP